MTSLTRKLAAKRPRATKLAADKPNTKSAIPKQPKVKRPTAKQVAAAKTNDLHAALRDTLIGLSSGTAEYPPTLSRLFELAGKALDAEALSGLSRALSGGYLQLSVKIAKGRPASYYSDSVAFLPQDADRVANSPLLLYRILRSASQATTKASKKLSPNVFNGAALVKLVPPLLAKSFGAALRAYAERTEMPAGIGMVRGGDPVFLLAEHAVLGARFPDRIQAVSHEAAATPSAAPTAHGVEAEFERAFQRAFERLNVQGGSHNYVLLHDLRKALPDVSRNEFDARLNNLRRDKTFSLDSADGRHVRLTAEQLEAGIREASSLLVYVARR